MYFVMLCQRNDVAMISQPARFVCRLLGVALVASLGAACSTHTVAPAVTPGQTATPVVAGRLGERAATIAVEQVGVPYRYGGDTPTGFDCSGLVHYAYARAGKVVPRTTGGLWNGAESINGDRMRAGDLLFFRIAGKMSHVGMYIGNDRFVHAPSSGKQVSIENLRSDYYKKALIRAGRPN